MDLAIIGLENTGKTTLLNQLATGAPKETVPTIGLNLRIVQKGDLKLQV